MSRPPGCWRNCKTPRNATGRSIEELLGSIWYELLDPAYREPVEQSLGRLDVGSPMLERELRPSKTPLSARASDGVVIPFVVVAGVTGP